MIRFSLIPRIFYGRIRFNRLKLVWDFIFGVEGRRLRFLISKKWHYHSMNRRMSYLSLALLFSVSLLSESFIFFKGASALDKITPEINSILTESIPFYSGFVEYNGTSQEFEYNKGYQVGGDVFGTKASPKFSANFPLDGSESLSITDPASGSAIKIKPQFSVGLAGRDQNRLVYPLQGRDGIKVISIGGLGYKEDIVLNSFQGATQSFSYELDIPKGVEARLDNDGSIGFYGVQSELLGNVSTGSDEDAELLSSALENGDKSNLLFRMPAPYVIEYGRRESVVDVHFKLDGSIVTTVATNLRQANYPLTIDPSVYVETARKFMRGNEETNVDFDVDNELIQKGTTTGARFNSWASTMDLNDGRFDGGSVTAGGYAYQIGGVSGSATENSTVFTSGTNNLFDIPSGVTALTVELWGGGGGGGAGGSAGLGGSGGGGGYSTATLVLADLGITDSNDLRIDVGGGGGGGTYPGTSGGGGGGGGHSEVRLSGGAGTIYAIAAGGGGGGGGDNSNGGAVPGGDGGAGGDIDDGLDGSDSSSAGGGSGAASGSGVSGGTGGNNNGGNGSSQTGGPGANGSGSDGGANNGGTNNGDGDGGTGNTGGYAAGGGGGSGYYGGGGGSASAASDHGGGGGGGGTAYFDSNASNYSAIAGSGSTPGNDLDADRSGAADGGTRGSVGGAGGDGDDGRVVIKYYTSVTNTVEDSVMWASIDSSNGTITSPNPGTGACTDWCTDSAYDLPEARRGFSLVAYNGFLYVIGGEDGSGNIESTVFIAKIGANGEPSLWHPDDPDKSTWDYWYEDTDAALSTGTKYTSVVAYNNRLYKIGGATAASPGGITTVEYTEIKPTGRLSGWSTIGTSALSTSRFMHSSEVYNGNLYVVGGDSSSGGSLLNTVEYVKLAADGSFNGSWESTSSFSGARRTNGAKFTTIYGAYIYLAGGCTSVSGGNCQSVGNEVQIASIFADGSLGEWSTDSNETNQRVAYGLHSWQGYIFRIGGCTLIVSTSDECVLALDGVDSGEINPPGEVSTVNITEAAGNGNCTTPTPYNCDLPPVGDGAGEGGQMLSMSVILNGYLYVIGGCTNFGCSSSSGNVSYVQIGSDGSLQRESTCVANGNTYADSGDSAWCVDNTNRVNGTSGVSAAGVTVFNNRIYIVGGIDESASGTGYIYHNAVNSDGSLDGSWEGQTLSAAGISGELSYTYAYARANPNEAGTYPGNLFIFGGCTSFGASAGCSSSYGTEVYKCNIETNGDIEVANSDDCTTANQLQIDSDFTNGGSQGIGAHAGTVYANRIYLIGGLYPDPDGGGDETPDRDQTLYAEFDDNNNVVHPDTGSSSGVWVDGNELLSKPRRRGSGFGYNGHLYAVGGFDEDTGTLPLIEWSKLNVSTGGIGAYTTSNIEINQRWGLSTVVSNSFAYIVGGCDVGLSPGGCSSFEESVQTFQLYNNDSGAQASYSEQTGNFESTNSRIGSSAAVLDGYIYVAGGENSGSVTNNVQYAKLNANGTIGSWSSTSANLPAGRAYGQLETAGGSLYYIGGEDSGGDEKDDVYYATPTSGAATDDVIRTTTYKLDSGEFTGTSYTLTLNDDLENDYFVMVAGASTESGGNNGPDTNQVRVDRDPFGNFSGGSTAANAIRLARGGSTNDWVGTVTVVECSSSCTTDGFELYEVLDTSLSSGNLLTDVSLTGTPSDFSNVVPFGAYLGGGLETAETGQNFVGTAGVEISRTGTNTIRYVRDDTLDTAAAAEVTTFVVEWGSNWNVQESTFNAHGSGGQGVDSTGEYATQTISSVERDNTWVWKSPGTSTDDGMGRGSFGKVLTLGDGVNENSSETTVAIGAENSGFSKEDTVYTMEHTDLAVDYEFVSRSNYGTSFTDTVASAIESETVSTAGNITSVEGYRVPLFYYTDSGNGNNYPKVASWSNYHSNDTTISFAKSFSGNNQSGWVQSVDFGANAGDSGGGDITTWSTASNGLPADRTRHGAAVWNDRIYVVGGLDNSASETNTVYISPKLSSGGNITSAWATDDDLPDVARSGGAVISYANNLYLLGGNDGSNYLSDVQFTSIGYKTGSISQSGTTVTGSGTTWTASMVGSEIQYADGSTANITTFNSATSLTVDASKTVTGGSRYLIDDGSVGNWTFSTSLPQYVSDADGFAANGFMYLFGGRSAASTCTNNSYVAPISANTTIESGNNPTGIGEWYQTNVEFSGDRYSSAVAYEKGKVYISGGGCGTELTSNQHYIGTLRAQPQVARYSYYVDANSDVFPNAWLLNGLDNNIGARWQFGYRSATDKPTGGSSLIFDEDFDDLSRSDGDSFIVYDADVDYDNCYSNFSSEAPQWDDSWSNSGTYSAKFEALNGTGDSGCDSDYSTVSTRFDRFYTKLSNAPTNNTLIYAVQNGASSGTVAQLQVSTSGNIRMRDRFTLESTFTEPLCMDSTIGSDSECGGVSSNRIEVGIFSDEMTVRLYKGDNANGSIPDETRTIALNDGSAPDDFNRFAIGWRSDPGTASTMWIDDHKAAIDDWVGSANPPGAEWGQDTSFGDVTLGRVESYTPLNTNGIDTEFARYFYLTISIDASQTFGYPDDVSRGPTIDDMTVFFTADPNKRLRHGKTFIQGVEQPLDTPCRVSGANPAGSQPNCPVP